MANKKVQPVVPRVSVRMRYPGLLQPSSDITFDPDSTVRTESGEIRKVRALSDEAQNQL